MFTCILIYGYTTSWMCISKILHFPWCIDAECKRITLHTPLSPTLWFDFKDTNNLLISQKHLPTDTTQHNTVWQAWALPQNTVYLPTDRQTDTEGCGNWLEDTQWAVRCSSPRRPSQINKRSVWSVQSRAWWSPKPMVGMRWSHPLSLTEQVKHEPIGLSHFHPAWRPLWSIVLPERFPACSPLAGCWAWSA